MPSASTTNMPAAPALLVLGLASAVAIAGSVAWLSGGSPVSENLPRVAPVAEAQPAALAPARWTTSQHVPARSSLSDTGAVPGSVSLGSYGLAGEPSLIGSGAGATAAMARGAASAAPSKAASISAARVREDEPAAPAAAAWQNPLWVNPASGQLRDPNATGLSWARLAPLKPLAQLVRETAASEIPAQQRQVLARMEQTFTQGLAAPSAAQPAGAEKPVAQPRPASAPRPAAPQKPTRTQWESARRQADELFRAQYGTQAYIEWNIEAGRNRNNP